MYKEIVEGKAKLIVPKEEKVSKELPVFYNSVMELNRTLSVLVLTSIGKKDMNIALPLAGTGVRAVRFLLELNKIKIKKIFVNDISDEAIKIVNKNLKLNKIKIKNNAKLLISKKEANMFLLENKGFDYIDIDPFGTPNPFLDSACKRITRGGILAVTATDTGPLAGTYPDACQRKYFAKSLLCPIMHEFGLRILIRKVQLIGAQFDKALTPVLSYFSDHYYRVFFLCDIGKMRVDKLIKHHGFVLYNTKTTESVISNVNHAKGYDDYAGPLWLGPLWDKKLVNKIFNNIKKNNDKNVNNKKILNLINAINEESKINTVGFYDIHALVKKNKLKMPTHKKLIEKIKNLGYKASRTHFTGLGIRSDIPFNKIRTLMKK